MPAQLDESRLRDLALYSTAGVASHVVSDGPLGSKIVHDMEIFKAGSFRDSMGDQRTWSIEQLHAMVSNFDILRNTGTFPNVPLRVDHSWSVEDVIGYVNKLAVSVDRLVADVEITEPDHFEKFERGTYRSRSLEVGMYEDNNGQQYFPTVLGLAFVDIPAVEGLHRGAQKVGCFRYQGVEENPAVPEKTETKPPELFKFRIAGADETDYAKVQAHVATIEGENTALKGRVETLETFAKEQVTATRHNYVAGLSTAKKIGAPQVDGLKALVETMTDDQFAAFQASYDSAPSLSILGNHTETVTNPAGEPSVADQERSVLEETVAMHRRAGMNNDDLAKTTSYRRLAELTAAK